jgi:Cys-tRNA synthase (O-phospho-L-seryl-tRNA:Cys-tRNA synthase)
MEREEAELRALEQKEASLGAAKERIAAMAEELRRAELVRDRLEGLDKLLGSYPEGHDMRTRLEEMHVDRALEGVNEDIRRLTDALLYPHDT